MTIEPENKYLSWLYNVRDCFKAKTTEEIKETLSKTKLNCSILIQHVESDFNMGSIIRTANNFNIDKIFYFGKKKWDRRGSTGCHNYSVLTYLKTMEEVIALKDDHSFIGFDNNVPGVVPIKNFNYKTLPRKPLICFGEESIGLHDDVRSLMDHLVEIPSLGSVRSLNVGTAAGIALYDFWSKL